MVKKITSKIAEKLLVIILLLFATFITISQTTELDAIDIFETNVMEWSPDGRYLATGHTGGIVLWDGHTGALLKKIPLLYSETQIPPYTVHKLSWSPDNKTVIARLAASSDYITTLLVDVINGRVLMDDIIGGDTFHVLDWSPDGTKIAATSSAYLNAKEEIYILDATTIQPLHIIPILSRGSTMDIKWSPDGSYLGVSYNINIENGVVVLDANTGEKLFTLLHKTTHESVNEATYDVNGNLIDTNIDSFDWSPDSKHIMTIDREGQFYLWSAETGEYLRTFFIYPFITSAPSNIDWSPIEDVVTVRLTERDSSRNTLIIDIHTGEVLERLNIPSWISTWKPDGSLIATIHRNTPLFFTRDGEVFPQFPIALGTDVTDSAVTTHISELGNGQEIDISQLEGDTFSIIAYANSGVKSMRFLLNDIETIDDESPFTLEFPPQGEYSLIITPFSETSLGGIEGETLIINFTVVGE